MYCLPKEEDLADPRASSLLCPYLVGERHGLQKMQPEMCSALVWPSVTLNGLHKAMNELYPHNVYRVVDGDGLSRMALA